MGVSALGMYVRVLVVLCFMNGGKAQLWAQHCDAAGPWDHGAVL